MNAKVISIARILSLFSLLLLFVQCEQTSNVCFVKKVRNSQCVCESLPLRAHSEPDLTSSLTCTEGDAIHAAIESKKSHNFIYINIHINDGTFDKIRHQDLKFFPDVVDLNLTNNKISFIEEDAFKGQKNLEVLDLSHNNLPSLRDYAFKHLFHLKNLSLSHNNLHSIESNAFYDLHSLEFLDLSWNNLSFVDNWFSPLKNLQYVLLCHNEISTMANNSFHGLIQLQRLDISFNHIKTLPLHLFYRLKNLNFLSLAMNQLETLNESTFKGNALLEKINLTGNQWVCDMRLFPLNDWLKKYEAYKEGALCIDPVELRNYTVTHALDILNLELKISENPTCNATMCSCTVSKDKLVVTVDCSSRGFTRLPEVVPYKTKVLNLYNNKIKSLNIDHINATLWSDVSFLYLNNNIIDSVKSLEGNWLLKKLVALHLSNNRLTEIPIHILEQIRGGLLDELYLSGNPWTCDCNTVRFQTWLQDNFRSVRNFDGICCSSDSGIYSNLPIFRLKKSQLCPQQVQLVNYLDVLNSIMAIAILAIIVKLSYDYWLQKRTGKLPRFFSLNL